MSWLVSALQQRPNHHGHCVYLNGDQDQTFITCRGPIQGCEWLICATGLGIVMGRILSTI
jgi:hypothetical protein